MTGDGKNRQQEGKQTTYCQVVNYLLVAYATDDVIAEAKDEITTLNHLAEMFDIQYSQALREKVLSCGMAYNKTRLRVILIEGLHPSNRYSIRTYWRKS